jgi:hypothetical protein
MTKTSHGLSVASKASYMSWQGAVKIVFFYSGIENG